MSSLSSQALVGMNSFEESPLGQVALEKAKELFSVCDNEDKGFIIKKDMQRLSTELPGLTPDQLEEVFDSLDGDHNGYLTMDEFVKGFGAFLGLQMPEDDSEDDLRPAKGPSYESGFGDGGSEGAEDGRRAEQEQFQSLLEELGAADVFKEYDSSNTSVVQNLWSKLRHDDPELLSNFEEFLSTVSGELKKSQEDFVSLESALTQRSTLHDDEVRKLYEEMEGQIRSEKQRVLFEERTRAEKAKEEMERELAARDAQLTELLGRQAELEGKIGEMNSDSTLTAAEKEALQAERVTFGAEKAKMEAELESMEARLDETKDQLDSIRKETREERKARAQASFKVTENIANERESLVSQLESLRALNKQLKDERDSSLSQQNDHSPLGKKDSSLGQYNLEGSAPQASDLGGMVVEEDECSVDTHPAAASMPHFGGPANSLMDELGEALRDGGPGAEQRAEPVGGNEAGAIASPRASEINDMTPERIFKVVFVGDSGVGKTCFLHRFCHDRFKPSFSATIGVDFQVKSIRVEEKLVALQLWDTAGQERFRSITKQYFRKADGVILMFDVTSEQSFLNIRNWMISVRDGVDKDCVLCVMANKIDLCESEDQRAVSFKDGQKLADEYETLYYESSAQSGVGISEAMQAMAILLREREDEHLDNLLKLDMEVTGKKSKCCGRS